MYKRCENEMTTAIHLEFSSDTLYFSPASSSWGHGIERTVLGSAGVGWNASLVVWVGYVDFAVDDSNAVWIVEAGLDYRGTGAVKSCSHNTRCLAPVRVIQIPVTDNVHANNSTERSPN